MSEPRTIEACSDLVELEDCENGDLNVALWYEGNRYGSGVRMRADKRLPFAQAVAPNGWELIESEQIKRYQLGDGTWVVSDDDVSCPDVRRPMPPEPRYRAYSDGHPWVWADDHWVVFDHRTDTPVTGPMSEERAKAEAERRNAANPAPEPTVNGLTRAAFFDLIDDPLADDGEHRRLMAWFDGLLADREGGKEGRKEA